jgi:hypothetical protein
MFREKTVGNWCSSILSEIDPSKSSLFVIRDPDFLLGDEQILEGIREKGFGFIRPEDPIALRLAYESEYRAVTDQGEDARLVIATDLLGPGKDDLPFDILEHAHILTFSLADLLPNLDPRVVAELDHRQLDRLFAAYDTYGSGQMGRDESIDFVLRHVFGVAPELVSSTEDLLLLLLRRHYRGNGVPETFDKRLVQLLRTNDRFRTWPLSHLLSKSDYFFAFLQERWIVALDEIVAKHDPKRVCDRTYSLACAGPQVIPFAHQDIRVYIDNLFLEGILKPIQYEHADLIEDPWLFAGIIVNEKADQAKRFERLLELLRNQLPENDAHHSKWLHYARAWAEGVAILANETDLRDSAEYEALQRNMDARFTAWVSRRFDTLRSLPPYPPAMVHHIPRFLARTLERDPASQIALLVMDGMAMDQWLPIRAALENSDIGFGFDEQAAFSWIPSITSVSRQALFSGLVPRMFPTTIGSTQREPALWTKFWEERGVKSVSVAYQRGLGSNSTNEELDTVLGHPKLQILGLVIDKVDKIMHGMELGTAGMHNQIRQWMDEGYLLNLLVQLFKIGFRVFITADHGNVEAIGCGRLQEGTIAETRGERVRVYSDSALRRVANEKCEHALAWNSTGIPDKYFPLFAPSRKAFNTEGKRTVSHGGISLEEVVVPFVEIWHDQS